MLAQHDIFQDRQGFEEVDDLKGPTDPEFGTQVRFQHVQLLSLKTGPPPLVRSCTPLIR